MPLVAHLVDARDGQHERGDGSPGDIHLPGGSRSDVLSDSFPLTAGLTGKLHRACLSLLREASPQSIMTLLTQSLALSAGFLLFAATSSLAQLPHPVLNPPPYPPR